ncbi:MAG: hypothetical protein M3Y72_04670 [Acidobacteriota bacterium]|nr:hypothetical protein [Acidobacteriota bacterium]
MMHADCDETQPAGNHFTATGTAVLYSLVLTVAVGVNNRAHAQTAGTHYAQMAPIAEYFDTDVETETALARSAAPAAISRDATVLVLKRSGYEVAQKGKNGFVCLVERAWMGPLDGAEFWNPKVRGAICFNPPAARSVLPITFKRTEFVLAGLTKAQMTARLIEVVTRKELPVLEAGSMSYMLAKGSYLGDAVVHWHPHLMFYGSRSDGSEWGADAEHSPVYLNPQFQGAQEPLTTYIVVAPNWSDGSPASLHDH